MENLMEKVFILGLINLTLRVSFKMEREMEQVFGKVLLEINTLEII